MTSRLYYTDAYATAFDGRITDVSADGQRVYLDQTAFYPTSGGQPYDVGSLGDSQVADVVDEDERVAHVLTAPLSGHGIGDTVRGTIDWARRFDHMQQHTGQHLLSAVFADLFGYETVSVHFGAERSSLDLDVGAIDAAQLGDAERRANEIVWQNRPVSVGFEDASTAAGLRLDDALVVPAGALVRGYVRCRALLLVGDIVGNVHCTAGPVVIRSGASLKGRLVASGDVYVCGTVGDTGGGAVITTRGKLTLAPGARVDGDVRSGWLDLYDGATLQGAAKGCED